MKILLVEDDTFFQKFYAAKLREKGYEVDQAEDGEVGLQKAVSFNPDIILLDLIMPKKDGFEVLQGLSVNPQLKNIPVLVFSTLGQEQDVQRAKQLGAKEYVNKSFFDFENLVTRIEALHKGVTPPA